MAKRDKDVPAVPEVEEEEIDELPDVLSEDQDWDIHSAPCGNCGNTGWSTAKVNSEGDVVLCNVCPSVKICH